MRGKLIAAAVVAISFGGFACQSRDVPTEGRAQAVEVGTAEGYPGSGGRLGGSQPAADDGRVGGVLRGGGAASGSVIGGDPGQIQTGGERRKAGHPVLGQDTTALSYGSQQGTQPGMGGAGAEGAGSGAAGENEATIDQTPHAPQNDQRIESEASGDAQGKQETQQRRR